MKTLLMLIVMSVFSVTIGAEASEPAAQMVCKKAALKFARAIRKVDAPAEDARATYAITDENVDPDSGVEFYNIRRTVRAGKDEGPWGTLLIGVYGEDGPCKLVSVEVPVG